jgi:hypothetical protein
MERFWRTIDILLGVSASKAEELTTGQVCLRAVVVYIVLIAYVRFAKKRFIGQATALSCGSGESQTPPASTILKTEFY